MNSTNYRIFPNSPEKQNIKFNNYQWRPENDFINLLYICSGYILWIILFVLTYAILYYLVRFAGFTGLGVQALITLVASVILAAISLHLIRKTINQNQAFKLETKLTLEAERKESERVVREAQNLTEKILKIYSSSITLKEEISEHLEDVNLWLREAEKEFKENAFSPFWDAIEDAALELADYDAKLNRLSLNLKEYYERLNGRKHNFPVFPVRPDAISDPSFVLKEFHRVIRLGQTNFHFANIWEHKRTRKVIIGGFRSLGEAVNDLAYTIESSNSTLQESLTSDIASVVEHQITTKNAVEGVSAMLEQNLSEQKQMLNKIKPARKL